MNIKSIEREETAMSKLEQMKQRSFSKESCLDLLNSKNFIAAKCLGN